MRSRAAQPGVEAAYKRRAASEGEVQGNDTYKSGSQRLVASVFFDRDKSHNLPAWALIRLRILQRAGSVQRTAPSVEKLASRPGGFLFC
jgi:hypothetical protein